VGEYEKGEGDVHRCEPRLSRLTGLAGYTLHLDISNPNGWSVLKIFSATPGIIQQHIGSDVYNVGNGEYLLLLKASNSRGRYFRSWTSNNLSGTWTPLAGSVERANQSVGAANDKSCGTLWTTSISHREVARTNVDQRMIISSCKLRYLYHGVPPKCGWRLRRVALQARSAYADDFFFLESHNTVVVNKY
jgi:hypothetical protein